MIKEHTAGIFELDTNPLNISGIVASYLVKGSRGTALIDPGFPSSLETVLKGIKQAGINPQQLNYILLTHSHIDHAGAAGALARIAQNARLICHKRSVFYLKNSVKISAGSRMVFGELLEELGKPLDIPGERICPVSEGEQLDLGDRKLTVFYTPGHAGDHLSFWETETNTLFSGDSCCIHYPALGHVLIPAGSPPIYKSDLIREELNHFLSLKPKLVLTPHFGAPASAPLKFLKENIGAVTETRSGIDQRFREGLEFPQVVEMMRNDVIAKSGKSATEIPEQLRDQWLRIMLKTGLMGFMADILEYARDIRPFHDSAVH